MTYSSPSLFSYFIQLLEFVVTSRTWLHRRYYYKPLSIQLSVPHNIVTIEIEGHHSKFFFEIICLPQSPVAQIIQKDHGSP